MLLNMPLASNNGSHPHSIHTTKQTSLRHSSPLREEIFPAYDTRDASSIAASNPASSSHYSLSNGTMSAAIDYLPAQAHTLGNYQNIFPDHIYGMGDRPVYSDSPSMQSSLAQQLPYSVSPALLTTKSPHTEPSRKRAISETGDSDGAQPYKMQRRDSPQHHDSPFQPHYTMSPEISSVYSTPALQPKSFPMAPMRHSPALSLSPSLLANPSQYGPNPPSFTHSFNSAPPSTNQSYSSPQPSLYHPIPQPSYSAAARSGLGLSIPPHLTTNGGSSSNGAASSAFLPDPLFPSTTASSGARPKPQCWDHGCNGRQFSTFSNLLRHQREKSGTAAKSYCPRCGAEFTRTTARNGHIAHAKCKARRHSAA